MIEGGSPALEALNAARETQTNLRLRQAVDEIYSDVYEGRALARAFRTSEVFSPLLIYMVGIGEKSGTFGAFVDENCRLSGAGNRRLDSIHAQSFGAGDCGNNGLAGRFYRHGNHATNHAVEFADFKLGSVMRKQAENGFSFIELMVVIVIIGLLTSVVALNVLPSQDRAMSEKARADVAILAQAIEMPD